MPGRNYVESVTVGDITIYNVAVNPNGVVSGAIGDLAVQSTAGQPVTWQNVNGGTAWNKISERNTRRAMGPTFSAGTLQIVPAGGSLVVSFPVPEECTLKQLIVTSLSQSIPSSPGADGVTDYLDFTLVLSIDSITVDIGPDSGSNLIFGHAPCRIFSSQNPDVAPDMNIRCPAGSTVTVRFNNGDPTWGVAIYPTWTYTPGLDATQPPNTLIGTPAQGTLLPAGAGNAAATFTINTAPLAAGDTIQIGLLRDNNVLTGVAGPRTPGSDDFDASLGTVGALQAEIVAAINDPLNSFSGLTAAPSGPADVVVTVNASGKWGNAQNLILTTAPPGGMTTATPNFVGGTSAITPLIFSTSGPNTWRLHRLYVQTVIGEGADVNQALNLIDLVIGAALQPGFAGECNGFVFDGKWPGDSVSLDALKGPGLGLTVNIENMFLAGVFVGAAFFARPAS